MSLVHALIDVPQAQTSGFDEQLGLEADSSPVGPGLGDLNALVDEVAVSYPLVAYTAWDPPAEADVKWDGEAEWGDEAAALDSMILAGLVTP